MLRVRYLFLAPAALLMLLTPPALAAPQGAEAPPVDGGRWHNFRRLDFEVRERECVLVLPAKAAAGRPWIWRTEFFGHEPQVDLALLDRGFHVACMDVQNMYGAPAALDLLDDFHAYLVAEYGLNTKVVLEGFSRGGLYALNWAARNPDKVACIYNDAPVCDFLSWPAGRGRGKPSAGDWAALLKAYGMTEAEALESRFNPINNLAPLAKAKIPLIHVCGAADEVVPVEENTALLAKRYRRLGGSIEVILKEGVGHHPHSLKDPAPIVELILRHAMANDH